MLTINLDVQKITAGGVLSPQGTDVLRSFCKVLCAIDTMSGSENVYTNDVFADAAAKLRSHGENGLAALVDEASRNTKALAYAAMSGFAANLIAAEAARDGKHIGETLALLLSLQLDEPQTH